MINGRYRILVPGCLLLLALGLASCGGPPPVENLDAQRLFEVGKRLYEEGKHTRATEYLQAVVFNFPGNSVVDTAQYYLGLNYFSNEDYELAAVEFNRLAINYPSSVFFENAVFMRAVSYYEATPDHYGLDQSDLVTALRQLNEFVIDFPESELVPDARKYISAGRSRLAHKAYEAGLVYERIGAPKAAKIYYQRVVDDYTDTEWAAKATYRLAMMDMRLKNYADARRQFENFAAVFPDHEWAGEAREKAARAAFFNCKQSYEAGDYGAARQCLQAFKEDFPGHGKVGKANEYIEKINQHSGSETGARGEHAGT